MTSPLSLHSAPAAGFDEPFEMLLACHERVQRMLQLLQRLGSHLAEQGCDANARQAARDVMRYFDIAGPAHHEDEERHVFPALLAEGRPEGVALVQRLHHDHGVMAQAWSAIRDDLQAVSDGRSLGLAPASARWQQFAGLYADHIRAEEGEAYPAARALLDAQRLRTMGAEMAARRGVVASR
jgi:hemerythrin-like domain-containing protein